MAPNPLTNDGHVRRCWESLVIRRCHFERCSFFFKKNARKCVDHPENPSMTKEQRGLCVYCWLKGLNLRAYWGVLYAASSPLAAAAAKSLQSCLTLCDPQMAGSPPSSAVPGILQARTLEWVAISFSNA